MYKQNKYKVIFGTLGILYLIKTIITLLLPIENRTDYISTSIVELSFTLMLLGLIEILDRHT